MRIFLSLAVILSLLGCAQRQPETVYVAPELLFLLPPLGALGRPVETVQLVTARRGDDVFAFEVRLSASPDRVLLVGTDAMGRRAMRISWADAGLEVERASWLPDTLRPENVLADLVLLYWPDEAVRHGLAASGAELVTGPGWRSVRQGGKEVMSITTSPDPMSGVAHLKNDAWHYEIEVRSSPVSTE